ncbi:tRNA (cytosine34-C5)-methyltransferase [Apostasia shenzhenica]|uniref:tRNA (Cytosine34-C5)-methyltransferase n=1 Tax=Apostasia shenzhenica TaxID=1088818 RepID=A0A2I0AYD7_9ASPA|nr:tRNA (cytosine34-C5)-methyltransferase [Apostasia shenzhenica]
MDMKTDNTAITPLLSPLPDAFLEFLRENDLDMSIYAAVDATPRYIRLKPGCESQLMEFEADLNCKLEKVNWLPGFFSIPPHTQIASTKAYQLGKIYGIDAASGAAVMALNVTLGDHVLDLCAAPGAKLCMLADLLGNSGSITGVDIARHRLAACRNMLQKYAIGDRCRLFVADGTTFSLLPPRSDARNDNDIDDTLHEWTSKRTWKDRKNAAKQKSATSDYSLSETAEHDLIFYGRHSGVIGMHKNDLFRRVDDTEYSSFGFDKVLVDAECTHDGSIKHIQKFEYWGWSTFQNRFLHVKRIENLTSLQLALLSNGFRLLKVGGFLVYSTCSLTVSQNENVVQEFLSKNPSADLIPVDGANKWCCKNGRIPNTLRFDPKTSQTSGLFIAKFTKLAI